MGQYHKLVSLTGLEFIDNGDLDCGLNAWEILARPYRLTAALAALISVGPGDGPADLSRNPFVGRWAAHRILCIGDYAEDGDAANIPDYDGPPLSTLYGLLDDDNRLPDTKSPGVYYNIAANVRGMLEYGRSDVPDKDLDQGQVRVLANYDRREFVDPAAFGEVPTTAGIMRGDWGSAAAMMGMLFEPESRGRGDLGLVSDSRLIGLWRNGRLFASPEHEHAELPTTGYIKRNWTDLSKEARQFITAIGENFGRE